MVSGVNSGPSYKNGFAVAGIQPVVAAVGAGEPAGKTNTCQAVAVGFVHVKVAPKEVGVAESPVGFGQAIPVVNGRGPAGLLIIPPSQRVLM